MNSCCHKGRLTSAAHRGDAVYRLLKIRDPRTPGFYWYEIEGRTASGETFTAAVCDTREEARQTIAAMRGAIR